MHSIYMADLEYGRGIHLSQWDPYHQLLPFLTNMTSLHKPVQTQATRISVLLMPSWRTVLDVLDYHAMLLECTFCAADPLQVYALSSDFLVESSIFQEELSQIPNKMLVLFIVQPVRSF